MHVSIATSLDTSALEEYLMHPIQIAAHQCYSSCSRTVFIKYKVVPHNYYGITFPMPVVDEYVAPGTILSVDHTEPYHLLRQLAFYKKCKDIQLQPERYHYAKMLAEQLATVMEPGSIAKPAATDACNCYYETLNWVLEMDGHKVQGSSRCLISSMPIKQGESLLYRQSKVEQEKTKELILEKFPIVFQLENGEWRCPRETMDIPVFLNGQLTNFMKLKKKDDGSYRFRFRDMSNFHKQAPNAPKRVIHLRYDIASASYKITKVINPVI